MNRQTAKTELAADVVEAIAIPFREFALRTLLELAD
jgi:hypothetical protein